MPVIIGSAGQTCTENFTTAGNSGDSSCPAGCAYSAGPEWQPEMIPAANRTAVSLTLAGDIAELSSEADLASFISGFKTTMAGALGGIRVDRVVVEKVAPGSIIVHFWIRPATVVGEPTASSLLTLLATSASDGTLATAIAAVPLPVLSASALVTVETTPNSGGSNAVWVNSAGSIAQARYTAGVGCVDVSISFPSYCTGSQSAGTPHRSLIGRGC